MISKTISTESIRLLSYNIHVGLPFQRYRDYVIGNWRHRISHLYRLRNLKDIATVVKNYDLVALQEVDCGSLRSGFINQVEYLATQGDFSYWHYQINRNLGQLAKFGNGIISKFPMTKIINHRLPGTLPGRGAIEVVLGSGPKPLVLILLHLALGKRSRDRQLRYIADLVQVREYVVVMGDMNCTMRDLMRQSPLNYTYLIPAHERVVTYPSWQPHRDIDHIWVSPNLTVKNIEVLPYLYSDHLPIAMELMLPKHLLLQETG